MRATCLLTVMACFLAGAPSGAFGQTEHNYTGICADLFVPGYPSASDTGTALEDFNLLGWDAYEKSKADCKKRGTGFFADAKAAFAHARIQALDGNLDGLPVLTKLATEGVAEAHFLIYVMYNAMAPVSPLDPNYRKGLPRDVAETHLRAAAEAGHLHALYELGRNLGAGQLVRKDISEARVWLEKAVAAADGNPDRQALAALELASIIVDHPQPADADFSRLDVLIGMIGSSQRFSGYANWLEIRRMRLGVGVARDDATAKLRAGDEDLMTAVPAVRAEYLELLRASGDSADRLVLLDLVERAKPSGSMSLDALIGEFLYSGVPVGRDRKRAFELLHTAASRGHQAAIDYAGRIVASGSGVKVSANVIRRLYEAVDLNLPGAALALITLRRSANSDARDDTQAAGLEVRFAPKYSGRWKDDGVVLYLLDRAAKTGPKQYWKPFDTAEGVASGIEDYVARGFPAARRIKGIALRSGKVMPQDDVSATQEIIAAAEAGDVAAMELAADAYSSGLGLDKNNTEELRWQMAAAKAGSIEAQRGLVFFLPFRRSYEDLSIHDTLVSAIVLYADQLSFSDLAMGFDRVFSAQDREELGATYIASGIMDGFRASLAARNDNFVVRVFKRVPKELNLVVEGILNSEGYLKKTPDGYMGPEARNALIAWARDRGLPEMEADRPPPPVVADARLTDVPVLPAELLEKLRDQAFKASMADKDKELQSQGMKLLATLAKYGDMAPRVAILKNYPESDAMRLEVLPGLATVYGIDVMLSEPPGAEKAPIDFIFTVTAVMQSGALPIAADVVLYTLRDDPRLRAKKGFNKVADQFIFIPGMCDALAERARNAGITGVEDDGCSAASRKALVDWATAIGPIGAEAVVRREAAEALLKLAK